MKSSGMLWKLIAFLCLQRYMKYISGAGCIEEMQGTQNEDIMEIVMILGVQVVSAIRPAKTGASSRVMDRTTTVATALSALKRAKPE